MSNTKKKRRSESAHAQFKKRNGARNRVEQGNPLNNTNSGSVFRWAAMLCLIVALGWAYWPTLKNLIRAWNTEPDYSHGFVVPLLFFFFLWVRRDTFPGFESVRSKWAVVIGLSLMAGAILLRVGGALIYLDAVDGWSLPVFLGGAVCALWGLRVFWWAAPAIAFLWFAVPLPYAIERWFRVPLQGIATKLSTYGLQILGQPAIAQGHTILLKDDRLEVADACSGMRIFMAVFALAIASLLLFRREWWEKVLILLLVTPIALLANSTRIITTGLLYRYSSGEWAKSFSHDFAGWATIVLAAGLFGLALWYLAKLFPEMEKSSLKTVMRESAV